MANSSVMISMCKHQVCATHEVAIESHEASAMWLRAHQALELVSCSTTADTMHHSKVDTQGACHQAGGGSVRARSWGS